MASTRDEADIDSTTSSGNIQIDHLTGDYYWSKLARENFQFTIPDDDGDYRSTRDLLVNDYPSDDYLGVEPAPVFFKQVVRQAIDVFKDILSFAIDEQGDNNVDTQLRYAITETIEGDLELPFHSPQDDGDGDVEQDQANWMSGDLFYDRNEFQVSNNPGGTLVGTSQYHQILIGTDWGLGVGVNGAAPLGTNFDSQEFTVHTTRGRISNPIDFAQTPMMLDIQALQFLYGADFTTRPGATTYKWDTEGRYFINNAEQWNTASNKIFLTIWDGGGEDTYDFSAFATNQNIDLTPGGWSNLGTQLAQLSAGGRLARGNVFNALMFNSDPRSLIENAIAGSGHDIVQGNFGHNLLNGGAGNDDLLGRLGFDTLIGGNGNDELFGHERDDILNGGAGADLINGGEGFDTAVYADPAGENITITPVGDPRFGRWDISGPAQAEGDILAQIEAFVFGPGHDQIVLRNAAGSTTLSINGVGGNDSIVGSDDVADKDNLIGGGSSDTINPRKGDFDVYGGARAANGIDWIERPADNDLLVLDRSDYDARYDLTRLGAGLGEFHNFSEGAYARGIARIWYTGSRFVDDIVGGIGDDILRGNGGEDNFNAYEGNDLLDGGIGNDALSGGIGNDTIFGGLGVDQIYGFEGDDLIRTGGGPGFEGALGGEGNDTMLGASSDEAMHGQAGNDFISTLLGDDQLNGADGNDTLEGGAGRDAITGDLGIDTVSYRTSDAGVTVNLGTNTASGGHATNDFISGLESVVGSAFADNLTGTKDANLVEGLGGNDQLTGMAGNDRFLFTSKLGVGNVDTISDFRPIDDTIALDNAVFSGLPLGFLQPAAFAVGPATQADDRILYLSGTGALFFDQDGSGGVAAVRFAAVTAGLPLTAADFLVV